MGQTLSTTRLTIANIILDGRFGGPQNQILQIAARLKRNGVETVVIIPKRDSETFYAKLIENKIKVKRLHVHRLTRHLPHLAGWVLFFLPELFSLFYYVKKSGVELVQCTGAWQMKGILAGKMARTKTVWRLQDTWTPRVIRVIFVLLARLFCDGFIVAGESVKQYYLNRTCLRAKKTIEIQASVDTSLFNPRLVKKDERVGNHRGLKITTVANINTNKGLEYFVQVARILNNKYTYLCFYIVGPQFTSQRKYSRELAQLISRYRLRNVYFYGGSNSIPSVLKATHIYVCSSVREASPNAVWEAMAMEKAIVSTDVGDIKRFIKDGVSGFIVPSRDAGALAEKVGILIENKRLRYEFGKRARATAVEEFDADVCARKHIQFYSDFMRG